MSEIRYDLLHDEYILIAPERLHRPIPEASATLPEPRICPFCPGHEELTPQEIFAIRQDGRWQTRVIPNLYKAVQIETPYDSSCDGINERWGGYGAHEILVDTPLHDATLASMSTQEIFWWLKTIQERVEDLARDPKLVGIDIFKNYGLKAGATQPHPHTQIIALPILSKHQKRAFDHAWRYYQEHGRSLHQDIATFESQRERALYETTHFFTFAPYASSFPFETILLAKEHATIAGMKETLLQELATHFHKLFVALQAELGQFDYNLLFYLPPLNQNFENAHFFGQKERIFRFFVRVTPRIYTLAGFELLTHSAINPVQPELAAKLLRRYYEAGS